MNSNSKKLQWGQHRYFIASGLLFLLLLLLTALFHPRIVEPWNQFRFEQNFSNQLQEIEAIDQELEKLGLGKLQSNPELLTQLNAAHLNLFVSKEDSLVFWSDYSYALPSLPDSPLVELVNVLNGYVVVVSKAHPSHWYRYAFRINNNYIIENEYLSNELAAPFSASSAFDISTSAKQGKAIYDLNGNYLFSMVWKPIQTIQDKTAALLFLIQILAFALLLMALFKWQIQKKKSNLNFALGMVLVLAAYSLQWLFIHWGPLGDSRLFDPSIFASGSLLNSLGSFTLHSLMLLFLVFAGVTFFFEQQINSQNLRPTRTLKPWQWISLQSLFVLAAFALLLVLRQFSHDLIFHSTLSFNILHISSLSIFSLLGLLAISLYFLSYFYLFNGIIFLFTLKNQTRKWKLWGSLISLLLLALIQYFTSQNDWISLMMFSVLVIFYPRQQAQLKLQKLGLVMLFLFTMSLLFTFWLHQYNEIKEHDRRVVLLQNLTVNQDPQAEYYFDEISKKLYTDTLLLAAFNDSLLRYDSITEYIEQNYFRKYEVFDRFDLQSTLCSKEMKLLIQPQNVEFQCDSFFFKNLIDYGSLTSNKNLYRLDFGLGQVNYLGIFRFYGQRNGILEAYNMYVEINSKLKRKGFTRLLTARGFDPFEKIADYSLAHYQNKERVEQFGDFDYPEKLYWNFRLGKDLSFYSLNGYNHLVMKKDKENYYLLSKSNPNWLAQISPFGLVLLLMSGVFVIFIGIFNGGYNLKKVLLHFSGRLQLAMISVILMAFALITLITLLYFQKLNYDKNYDRLESLAKSLQIEFEQKINRSDGIQNQSIEYINSLLLKFASVFDTDINLYDIQGKLMATTRKEVFEYPLLSNRMNPEAFQKISKQHLSLYISKENIGKLQYSSAYTPFHDSEGKVVAYLNLPYFAREEVLQSEMSSLIMSLFNVYTLIIVLSILVIMLVSRYVSRPLQLLRKNLQMVGEGNTQSKISWKGIEEIEMLVQEYNHMIDALEASAQKLAQSERESAWREMAKQVAHEIKNPLTPMKLTVQYLMLNMQRQENPDPKQLANLAQTLLEQIDALTEIANSFSDFAQFSSANKGMEDLLQIIKAATNLYENDPNVHIQLICQESEIKVLLDKNQWIRLFNNLIKNSTQAVDTPTIAHISIKVWIQSGWINIDISDNGCGMSAELLPLIFEPKFTTKKSGAGLGLAIVKSIVNESGGSIGCISHVGKGSTFSIQLPYNQG